MKPKENNLEKNISRLVKLSGDADRPGKVFVDSVTENALDELKALKAGRTRKRIGKSVTVKWLKVFVGIAAIAAIVMVLYFPNYAKLNRLRQTNEELLGRIQELEGEIGDLESKMERVGDDPQIYEEIARDTLGVAKRNEIVIDIEQ